MFVTDDLTKTKARMLYELRQAADIERVYSLDCKLFCVQKMHNGEEKRCKIESPDDLFSLGWSEERVREFYLN